MNGYSLLVLLLLVSASIYLWLRLRQARQLAYIRDYVFHRSIRDKILQKYPQLSEEQTHLVFRALRDYFHLCNRGGRRMIAMPSQVVDDAWHEFILFTRSYQHFCRKALGRFLHHTPTEAMRTPTQAQEGIKRAWRLACARERIDPAKPARVPLLFAIDGLLNIPNGFTYVLNCTEAKGRGAGFCAGHIGCSSGCAGDSGAASDTGSGGFFDGLFDGDGGGCGGGCGGD